MSAAPQVKDVLKFDVEIVGGPHAGQKLSVAKGAVTLGRGPENDIVLSSDPRVSRQHAEIKARGSDLVIVNLSQKNFVLVNGQNIQSEVVTETSVIQLGDTEVRIHIEAPTAAPPIPPPPSPAPSLPDPVVLTPIAPVMSSPRPPVFPQAAAPQMPVMPPAGGMSPAQHTPMPPAQPMAYGGYSAPSSVGMGPAPTRAGGPPSGGLLENPKVRFYGVVGILGLLLWFFLSPSGEKTKKDPNAFRTSSLSMVDVAEAEKRSQELLTIKKEKYDSIQYRRAQENFIKGFRDFQQGQYARAREAFQVVLNLDPENELAKRYFHLSKIKFDELVKFNMIQGNRYREKRNWRMCQSNYSNVMTMLQHRKDDPSFKEAKQFYEECTLNLEGRF